VNDITEIVLDYLDAFEVCAKGIATVETLAGGPPSADISYVLPGAKSAVSFALPLDQSLIPSFLGKADRNAHDRDNMRTNTEATGIAQRLADFLSQKGHPSVPVSANDVYRADAPLRDLCPPVSHRYLAVRSGVGHFGLSGNVITKTEGAAIILGSVVTTAELVPTSPLPADENYCDNCGMCLASCISGFVNPREKTDVMLGGIEFSYSKRGNYIRCGFVCGGHTGLHPSGKWSTWSPGRFEMPEDSKELVALWKRSMVLKRQWPRVEGGYYNFAVGDRRVWLTCNSCQLVCHPDPEERKRRHKLLTDSGVVIQNPDGDLEVLTPEEAEKRLAAMNPEVRALYEESW